MPCFTVQEVKVQFSANTDRNMLNDALEAAGLNPKLTGDIIKFNGGSYHCGTHQFTFSGLNQKQADAKVTEFKRAYSAQVVLTQAKRFGWQVKQTAQYEYEIVRR